MRLLGFPERFLGQRRVNGAVCLTVALNGLHGGDGHMREVREESPASTQCTVLVRGAGVTYARKSQKRPGSGPPAVPWEALG